MSFPLRYCESSKGKNERTLVIFRPVRTSTKFFRHSLVDAYL